MGLAVVRRLLERGHEVTVLNRGTRSVAWPSPLTEIHADRDDRAALEQIGDLELDGVVDTSAYTAAQTDALLDVLGNVPRLVHTSTGAVYRPQPELPWPEATPYGPFELWGAYAGEKLACERVLRARRPASLATTAIRLPYVLGPLNYVAREEFVLNRLLDGAEILLPGDGQAVQQFVSTEQVGHAMVAAVECFDEGGFRAFNVASPGLASLEGFVQICARVAGAKPRLRAVGGGPTGNDEPVFDVANPVFPFPNANYALDLAASERAGIAPPATSLEAMVRQAHAALLAHPERRSWSRTAAEQALLAS